MRHIVIEFYKSEILKIVKLSKNIKINIAIIILYTVITIILTYPLIMHVGDGLEQGDPALNTWILAWDVHSILTDPFNLFNANMFFPFTHNTLTFSEHLFADMLVAFPIILTTHNPILAYNIILILSFIFSAYGTFSLINYYINDKYSAFIGGVIFAFCTIRFAQIGHLQFLTVQWLPFALLYLDKFLHKENYYDLILLYIFFILQVLSSWYLAFYTAITLSIYGLCLFTINEEVRRNLFQRSFQLKSVIFIISAIIVIAPFAFPYLQVAQEYGFTRTLDEVSYFSANLGDYFLTPINNLVYGKMSEQFQINRNVSEHSLFPGLTAVILALYGLCCIKKFKITSEDKIGLIYTGSERQNIYLFILFLTFILSLGSPLHFYHYIINIDLPYKFLYEYLPGFKSMRVPSRFGIIVMLALSILASYGVAKIIRFRNHKFLISFFIVVLIITENLYIPWSWGTKPIDDKVPEVYKWLSNDAGNFSIVEIPVGRITDSKYLYYSTYHWKYLVNGYSGFVPQGYLDIINILQNFPSNESIDILRSIGVKYIIIHSKDIDPNNSSRIEHGLLKYSDCVSLVKVFENDYVYEINLNNAPINPFITISGIFSTNNWEWLQSDVTFQIYSEQNRTASLNLQALSFYRPRTLEIILGSQSIAQIKAYPTGLIESDTKINLAKGANTIRLHIPKDCDSPCDRPELGNPDCRCLNVAVSDIKLE